MIGSFDKTPSFLPKECKEPARDAWLESQTSWEQVYLIIFRSSRINFNIFHYLGPFIYDPYCLVPTKLFRVVWVFECVCRDLSEVYITYTGSACIMYRAVFIANQDFRRREEGKRRCNAPTHESYHIQIKSYD